jgi:hypothetical protein
MEDNVKKFREVAEQLCNLYQKKNECYDDSFGKTYDESKGLGLIGAITRLSDKRNRLFNIGIALTKHKVIQEYYADDGMYQRTMDDLGESLTDTLMDLAAYSIMTIVKLNENEQQSQKKD